MTDPKGVLGAVNMNRTFHLRRIGCELCLAAFLILSPPAQASPWAKVKVTSPGPAAAIGGTSNGCIAGAEALPTEGAGFVSIRRQRNRYYGHPVTVRFVKGLGRELRKRSHELIMVGDISQPRGGLMSSMHRSHQNGIDVDIWFHLADSSRAANLGFAEGQDPESMVAPGGLSLTKSWSEYQRFLLKASADDPRVDRIFVNPAIKRALCRSEKSDRTWLRKLRPWWGHDAHFHVRLKCPAGSPLCKQQAPLPPGDGCDKSLAWWFSEEARTPSKKPKKKRRPPMPAACEALLTGY
jgi:penicillin-insensitive murein endopeptidase